MLLNIEACPPWPSLPARRRDLWTGKEKSVDRSVTPMRTAKVLRLASTHLDMLLEPPGEATLSEMDW